MTPVTDTFDDNVSYTYDPFSRLTLADYCNTDDCAYTYDAVGNTQRTGARRLTQVTDLSTTTYTYDIANHLKVARSMTTVNGVTYTWDNNHLKVARGNLTNDGVNTYAYTIENRLSSITNGGETSYYYYNGLGDRLFQLVDGVTTHYMLDMNAALTQVLTDGTQTYLYGLSRLGQKDATTMEFFLGDALGSVRQMTDSIGAITLEKRYTPFGEVIASTGTGESVYGYTGEVTDPSGLVYLRARYYEPGSGRFIIRDTWAGNDKNPISYNHWLYANSNAIMTVDPSGYVPCVFGGDQFCILDNGAFIDESHFALDEAIDFWEILQGYPGKGIQYIPLSQPTGNTHIGMIFTSNYEVDIPKISSISSIGAGIWWDYQKRFEKWQATRFLPFGTHSSFETADIPSTYLAYVSAVRGYSYETIVGILGGGYSSPTAPLGHDLLDIASWNACELLYCIQSSCFVSGQKNDTIFLKTHNNDGTYRFIPYPGSLFIQPSNQYWKWINSADAFYLEP